MVFCIEEGKEEILATYISKIVNILKKDKRVSGIAMRSYLIHIPAYDLNDFNSKFDGVNINLTLVVDEEFLYENKQVKELINKIKDEFVYNLFISTISKKALKYNNSVIPEFLSDIDILYDKSGELTTVKNKKAFYNKSENLIEFQPKLKINK